MPENAFTGFVAALEILRGWFPFNMGINEKRYPFMDEGWTTAFECVRNPGGMAGGRPHDGGAGRVRKVAEIGGPRHRHLRGGQPGRQRLEGRAGRQPLTDTTTNGVRP